MSRLANKVVLITGGNSGIGLATAQLFVKEGAKVVITARRAEAVEAYNSSASPNTFAILADAADTAANEGVIKTVIDRFGKLDVLFLNAGVAKPAPIDHLNSQIYNEHLDINFRGPVFTVQSALPHLNKGASIIFNTSISNVKGMAGMGVYAATKAGLRSLVRTLTSELSGKGIRVNAVSPGPIGTPIYDKMGLGEEAKNGFATQIQSQVPLGRFGEPSEVANVVLFLASDESSYVTGTEIPVDGGMAQV